MPQAALVEPLRPWDPEQVGGFVLLGRLGAGAMGQVYLGRSAAGRLVAVKTIKTGLAEEPDFRTRFGQEVAAARRVSGAFTAAVVAADAEADVPWLATVYVPAPSLAKLVRTCGPMSVQAVRWLAAGCAEALESIHGVGLVHRDLKPSNVLVSPDGPRVIDFGVARAAERIQLTVTRGSVGTPEYMAPEQARDTRQATSASDIFSLGATLLFAATGHAPYAGETVVDVLVRLATGPPDLAGLPPDLADLVVPCLDRDPRSRPTSASIIGRVAPGLAAGSGPGSAPLSAAAVRLIEEYRRAPSPSARAGPEPPDEATLGSRPAAGDLALDWVEAGPAERPTAARPARPARPRILGRGPDRHRLVLAAGTVAACAALIGGGWAIGALGTGRGAANVQLGPVLPPPGSGPRPGPAANSRTLAPGQPGVGLDRPAGDPHTIFIVHGLNFPVGKPVTISLSDGRVSPIHPVADGAGTFNYAVNQDHEFFAGPLPPGIYTIKATAAGGASAQATFDVVVPG